MKILPVGAELFIRTDGHDEASSRFPQLCERNWKRIKERMCL